MYRGASTWVLLRHMGASVEQELNARSLPRVSGEVERTATLIVDPIHSILGLGEHDHQCVFVPIVGCQVQRSCA